MKVLCPLFASIAFVETNANKKAMVDVRIVGEPSSGRKVSRRA